MKTLLSKQAIYYLYQKFVKLSLAARLPNQRKISEAQLDKIFGIVKSAANTVFGKKLYPSIYQQAAFILYQLNKQHILLDGNKRFSLMLTLYILDTAQVDHSKMSRDDWEMLVMRIASDPQYLPEQAVKYLKNKLKL